MLDLIHDLPPDEDLAPGLAPLTPRLLGDPERRLHAARPRLLRLVRALGIPSDASDDVVQDVLFAAWRQLDRLREPERFDAWLDAIARNHCRMYLRRHGAGGQSGVLDLVPAWQGEGDEADVPDPLVVDPLEEVGRQDLATLLDRALGYLPVLSRTALEQRYLADASEHDTATLLGLNVNALEARLHRARRQLRRVLGGPLRADAEALGLNLTAAPPAGWQETRLWCNICGRRRLLGAFERGPDGHDDLRLRCPDCSVDSGCDIYRSKGIVSLKGLRSFRPALTRTMRAIADITRQCLASGTGPCPHCGAPARWRLVAPDDLRDREVSTLGQHWVIAACSRSDCLCADGGWTAVEPAVWFHPAAQRFMAEHPRWVTRPDEIVERDGRPAIRFELADVTSAARLSVLADPTTLDVLAAFPE